MRRFGASVQVGCDEMEKWRSPGIGGCVIHPRERELRLAYPWAWGLRVYLPEAYRRKPNRDAMLLHPTLTDADLRAGCELAAHYRVASVCVKPYAVRPAAGGVLEQKRPGGRLLQLAEHPHDQPIMVSEFGGIACSSDPLKTWRFIKLPMA